MSFFNTAFGSVIKNTFVSKIGISILAGAVGTASGFIMGNSNNPVEKGAEAIIKAETGLDIDLTPEEKTCVEKNVTKCVEEDRNISNSSPSTSI